MIWAEDAIRQFGCRVLVGHLFLIVPDPATAYMCLLASGEYEEACSTIAYRGQGLLETAPRLKPLEGYNTPLALLGASDWENLPPIALSPKPQFPSLHTLLSSLLGTWLQQPFSPFSFRLAVWITSVYEARDDPALVRGPSEGGALGPYLRLCQMMPARLRQLHIDLVHNRVFILAYAAYVHYSAIAETVDQHAAATGLPDPIDMPPPSNEEIGKGSNASFWYAQHISSVDRFFTNWISNL
jgi:hypothetical protein